MRKREKIRVLMAIPGFDGHWKGAVVVSSGLKDAGMEVIYVGQQQPENIAESAIQEDVDVVGLSIYAAGHIRLIRKVLNALKEKGREEHQPTSSHREKDGPALSRREQEVARDREHSESGQRGSAKQQRAEVKHASSWHVQQATLE